MRRDRGFRRIDLGFDLLNHLTRGNRGGGGVFPRAVRLVRRVRGFGDDVALLDSRHHGLRGGDRGGGGGDRVFQVLEFGQQRVHQLGRSLGGGLRVLQVRLGLREGFTQGLDQVLVNRRSRVCVRELGFDIGHGVRGVNRGLHDHARFLDLNLQLVPRGLGVFKRSFGFRQAVQRAHELLRGCRDFNRLGVLVLRIRELLLQRLASAVRFPRISLGISKVFSDDLNRAQSFSRGAVRELRRRGDGALELFFQIRHVLVRQRRGFDRHVELFFEFINPKLALRSIGFGLFPRIRARVVHHGRVRGGNGGVQVDGREIHRRFGGSRYDRLGSRLTRYDRGGSRFESRFVVGKHSAGRRRRRRRRRGRGVARVRVRVEGNCDARVRVHEILESVVQGHLAQLLGLAGGQAAQPFVRAGVEPVEPGEVFSVRDGHFLFHRVEAFKRGDCLRQRRVLGGDQRVVLGNAFRVFGEHGRELVVRLDQDIEGEVLLFFLVPARLREAHELRGLNLQGPGEALHGVDRGLAQLVPPNKPSSAHVVVLAWFVETCLNVFNSFGHVKLVSGHERVRGVSVGVGVGGELAVVRAFLRAHLLQVVRGGDDDGVV